MLSVGVPSAGKSTALYALLGAEGGVRMCRWTPHLLLWLTLRLRRFTAVSKARKRYPPPRRVERSAEPWRGSLIWSSDLPGAVLLCPRRGRGDVKLALPVERTLTHLRACIRLSKGFICYALLLRYHLSRRICMTSANWYRI